MPKLPLLLEIRPSLTTEGPTVFLSEGNWKFEHSIKDSEVVVMLIPPVPKLANEFSPVNICDPLLLSEGYRVKAVFRKAGTEKYVSLYACKDK